MSDLPEAMKNVLHSSRAAPRIGFSASENGIKRITINRPISANAPMGAGFFVGETGKRRILPETPQEATNKHGLGITITLSGKTVIQANPSDLLPPDGSTPDLRIGLSVTERHAGLRSIRMALPDMAGADMLASVMVVNAGRSIIPANLEDIKPSRMKTNAVGRMHVGLAQIGI